MSGHGENTAIENAMSVVRGHWSGSPRYGLVLGTGASEAADRIDVEARVDYADIPGFAASTALGHRGQLVCGTLGGREIVAMQGRVHLYEGYSRRQIAFPIEVMDRLGVNVLLVTNACGGINPRFNCGELMAIESHLDFTIRPGGLDLPPGKLRPEHRADVAYDGRLIDQSLTRARRDQFVLHRGVYAAMLGPNYETRAEYRFLRRIGADAAGMSTVPEVCSAAGRGMRVLALSIIANVARPDALVETSGQQVIEVAQLAAPRIWSLVDQLINEP